MSFVYIFVFVISTTLILVLKGDAQIFVAGISAYIYEGLWTCDVIRRLIFLPLYKKQKLPEVSDITWKIMNLFR